MKIVIGLFNPQVEYKDLHGYLEVFEKGAVVLKQYCEIFRAELVRPCNPTVIVDQPWATVNSLRICCNENVYPVGADSNMTVYDWILVRIPDLIHLLEDVFNALVVTAETRLPFTVLLYYKNDEEKVICQKIANLSDRAIVLYNA